MAPSPDAERLRDRACCDGVQEMRIGEGVEMNTKDQGIGAKLRGARECAGLTQVDLAKRAGMTSAAISNIERGSRRPMAATIRRLEIALGCSLDYDTIREARR